MGEGVRQGKFIQEAPVFRYDTQYRAMKDALKNPPIGVTQGGSSRKNAGAKVAAVNAEFKPTKIKLEE